MGLETGTFINSLNAANPTTNDPKSQGDDHLRLIKSVIRNTFTAITGAINATHTELNFVQGVTGAIQTQLNARGLIAGQVWAGIHDFTATTITVATQAALDSSTKIASTAYADLAVTVERLRAIAAESLLAPILSPVFTGSPSAPTPAFGTRNTQLATTNFVANEFSTISSPVFTGSPTAPTPAFGDSSENIATTEFVSTMAFSSSLPAQTGNSGKTIVTNGTTASWGYIVPDYLIMQQGII
jgi:hypothetical protein